MIELNNGAPTDIRNLKQRVAELTASQRALLARRLEAAKPKSGASDGLRASIPRARPLRVEQQSGAAVYPASPGQQQMWFLHHYAPESPVYNVVLAFHLAGPLNLEWLEAAFQAVIRLNDTLRTTFAMEGGGLVQRVAASSVFQLQIINLEQVPTDSRKAAVENCLTEQACRPFDLSAGPLFRSVLVRLQPAENVLLLAMHHIISDGWSRSNFCRELAAVYGALAAGKPAPHRELAVQYADYSAWQKDWLASGALTEQAAYWKTKLAPEPEPLELPSDRARPATESFRGGSCLCQLDPALTAALKTRAQEEGATLFMILLAAFKTLLHRYTGNDDLIVGVPIANRQRAEVEPSIGFFVNTLVMRTTFPGDPTFRELLRCVKATAIEAYTHQDMPFEQLVELLQVRRETARPRLFQVSFAVQDFPVVEFALPEIQTTPWFVTTNTCKFDLSLAMEHSAEGWRAVAEYSTDLFDRDRVERMLEHWRRILESVAANPDQRLSKIPLLSAAEGRQLLVEWNQTNRAYPRDKCVHQLFEEQVERAPDAVAVVFEEKTLTYRELNARANQLAQHLKKLGVGPDQLVGLFVERSLEMVILLLGILKAGGAYWALEEKVPEERLQLMLADARPRVVVAGRTSIKRLVDLAGKLAVTPPAVVAIEDLLASSATEMDPGHPTPNAGSPVYVSYTSGSTGRPKGVVVPHRAVVRLVKNTDFVSLSPKDTLLHLSLLAFDASTFEIWGALLNGGRLVLMPPGPPALSEIGEAIRRHGVTTLWLTAGLFHLMVDTQLEDLKPLRQLLAGGEALSAQRVRKARRALAGCRIVNGYGPTENTTFTCCYTVEDERELIPSVPIGRPIANTQVYVLDRYMQPVPVGVAGELYAGGDGVACGYLNQPKLTADRFVDDPFSSKPDARLYRTGDLARWRADGNLEFLGRLDNQVKIRGFRIEVGEIEAALAIHPSIVSAAVVAREDVSGSKCLAAYLVTRETPVPAVAKLREFLLQKLPDYMVPAVFVNLEKLPLTANGKINYKALPTPDANRVESGIQFVSPRTATEAALAKLWCELLGMERVGIGDDFFALGGHSLRAVVLSSRLKQELGVEVPLRWIFEHPTIERLAQRIASKDAQGNLCSIPKVNRQQPIPMSFAQQGMWLLHQTVPDPATYNVAVAWRLSGRVDEERVRCALQVIQQRHEVLRTALLQQEGKLVQRIVAATAISLPWRQEDLQAVPEDRQAGVLEELLVAEARQPFDLAKAPLRRVTCFKLKEDEQVLAFTFHHSIVDAWSLRLFFEELERLYAAQGRIELAQLPELPVQYADYASWQRQRLTGELLGRQRSYWGEKLRDLPPTLELPTDWPRPVQASGRGAIHHFQLNASVVARLRELAREEKATLFTVVLAAFQVWLHRYTNQNDLVVGTPITGRDRPETQALMGFFLNTLPIRVRLDSGHKFREVVQQVRETVLDAFSHAELPFEQMVELAVKKREANQQPLYQVMFVLLEEGLSPLRLGQAQARFMPMRTKTSKNDLILSIQAAAPTWDCQLEFAKDLFSSETAARMARNLTELLESIAKDPQQAVSQLSLQLPEYMIPSRIVQLKALPPGSNGKVDRKALEKLDEAELARGTNDESRRIDLESKLVEIWQEVFRRSPLGVDDNFFDLGGHSLLAVSVQARVEKELGKRLPLAAFFKAATVRELAKLLSEPGSSAQGVHFPGCRSSQDKPHLFCLHHLSAAQRLAKHLDPHWPVYGIESPFDDELRRWHTCRQLDLSLEELAARNLAMIKRVQPSGPYFLAGFCFGGVVAFEVARQMQCNGERVALLALLDAAYHPGLKPLSLPGLRRWAYHAKRASTGGAGYVLKKIRMKLELDQRRRAALQARQTGGREPDGAEIERVRLLQTEFLGQMLRAYQAKPYSGSAFLLRTLQEPTSFAFELGATSGWSKVILGGIQVEDIPCSHAELAEEPHVGEVARKLAFHLHDKDSK